MRFEWDERKNRANYAKHGVSFEVARLVFNDPWSITLADSGIHDDAPRWLTIGSAAGAAVLFIVHIRKIATMAKKSSALSQRAKPRRASANGTYAVTRKMARELKVLAAKPDDEIDTSSDMPEIVDWQRAMVGKFYRPIKQPVSIRLDADVVAWFKGSEPKYQTAVNRVLRDYMLSHRKSA